MSRKQRTRGGKPINTIIDCPWRNCSGVIDLGKEFANWPHRGRTAALVHTIMCPKCFNVVGSMELGADVWADLDTKKKTINDPKTGELVTIKKGDLKKYLKKWARR